MIVSIAGIGTDRDHDLAGINPDPEVRVGVRRNHDAPKGNVLKKKVNNTEQKSCIFIFHLRISMAILAHRAPDVESFTNGNLSPVIIGNNTCIGTIIFDFLLIFWLTSCIQILADNEL